MTSFQQGDFTWDNKSYLGEGTFGKVYKCKNIKKDDICAVKVMDMKHFKDKYMIDSLKNEINIMKQLTSQHVVQLIDCINTPKFTYIFLEFCEGGDLRKYITKKSGKLAEPDALEVLNQLMMGFKELVQKGYIHRDIKPENCLVKNNIFKVADFGFATKADLEGRLLLRDCVGTPLYMAPQLLENKPYTAKSDLWSIGMMFYEMLFGKTPWPARDIKSFLKNIYNLPLRFPYDKPIGAQTKNFIKQCLTIDEKQRIGWDEVFKHSIINRDGGQIEKPEVLLDEKAKKILRSMQEIVQAHNLNVSDIFNKFDTDGGGSLDDNEFFQLLSNIDPRITSYESNYIFTIVDSSQDGKVSILEFQNIFCQYDFSDIEDKVSSIITDLKEIIKCNNLNLKEIFANFDRDKRGTLDREEFEKLIKVVAPAIKNAEIQECFDKFDINKDGNISFEEFYKMISYGIQIDNTNQYLVQEKAKKIISEIKRICKDNNVNVKTIFKNIQKSKNESYVELNQFQQLIQIIDKCIQPAELQYIFNVFDKNQNGKIELEEFLEQIG